MLFAFDSDRLSPRTKAILDEVAAETRAKADPAKPPIIIEGHTDGKGTHDYNVSLSERRAQAVLNELRKRLGTGYQYKAEGKGETEPIAKEGGSDDEKARQRNRRVEISYKIKQRTGTTTTTTTRAAEERQYGGGTPAPFRPADGKTVATREATFGYGPNKRRLDVKPFYRDGAYLVVVYELTNLGPGGLSSIDNEFGELEGRYGSLGVVDPATGTKYRAVRIGPEPESPAEVNLEYVNVGRPTINTGPNTTNRGFFYVPAPPLTVKTVAFDAGAFGQIPGIPIE